MRGPLIMPTAPRPRTTAPAKPPQKELAPPVSPAAEGVTREADAPSHTGEEVAAPVSPGAKNDKEADTPSYTKQQESLK